VPWPAGLTLLHVYVTANLVRAFELAAMIASCREATRGEPLTHVGDPWLHITLCQVTIPASSVDEGQRAALAASVGEKLIDVGPFTITVGPPFPVPTGVLLGVANGRLELVRHAVSDAVAGVLGTDAVGGNSGPLHMSESYAYADADDARIESELAAVHPRRASLLIEGVDLVDVSADQAAKTITWTRSRGFPFPPRSRRHMNTNSNSEHLDRLGGVAGPAGGEGAGQGRARPGSCGHGGDRGRFRRP
jgi:hypothetical protein